jgi:hypothetical protein
MHLSLEILLDEQLRGGHGSSGDSEIDEIVALAQEWKMLSQPDPQFTECFERELRIYTIQRNLTGNTNG